MTQAVNTTNSSESAHRRELATAINGILLGRINSTGTFVMTNGSTSTVVTDPNAHPGSVPLIMGASATLPSAQTIYISARALGSFTVAHAAPVGDKTYLYALLG